MEEHIFYKDESRNPMAEINGLVYKSTGSWYLVADDTGTFWNARIKGKMKIDEEISSTNPIAVGDRVVMEIENAETNTATILKIDARNNYIARVSPHNRHQKHIVAANLDAALIMATLAEPRTSMGFVDRFLVTAGAYHIPAIIVLNKTDLLKPKHQNQLEQWMNIYGGAGYELYPLVALDVESLQPLKERLRNRTTLFSGHSGVGKSTLINMLIPGKGIRTKEISGYSGKGQHTTTFAEMYQMPSGGMIIDTPGVKEFGLIDMEREELSHYFPEMLRVLSGCRFNNCLHYNEPGCAVKEAVNEGQVSEERYISYLTILETIIKQW